MYCILYAHSRLEEVEEVTSEDYRHRVHVMLAGVLHLIYVRIFPDMGSLTKMIESLLNRERAM